MAVHPASTARLVDSRSSAPTTRTARAGCPRRCKTTGQFLAGSSCPGRGREGAGAHGSGCHPQSCEHTHGQISCSDKECAGLCSSPWESLSTSRQHSPFPQPFFSYCFPKSCGQISHVCFLFLPNLEAGFTGRGGGPIAGKATRGLTSFWRFFHGKFGIYLHPIILDKVGQGKQRVTRLFFILRAAQQGLQTPHLSTTLVSYTNIISQW